jgi:hypothetical protein
MLRGSDAVNSSRAVDVSRDAGILDLGGATGRHIHDVLPFHSNITVCDISERDLKQPASAMASRPSCREE